MASRSAREVAYETVRSRIITMELKPGDPLNDRELAEELGISRTPERDAFQTLAAEVLITLRKAPGSKPERGFFC